MKSPRWAEPGLPRSLLHSRGGKEKMQAWGLHAEAYGGGLGPQQEARIIFYTHFSHHSFQIENEVDGKFDEKIWILHAMLNEVVSAAHLQDQVSWSVVLLYRAIQQAGINSSIIISICPSPVIELCIKTAASSEQTSSLTVTSMSQYLLPHCVCVLQEQGFHATKPNFEVTSCSTKTFTQVTMMHKHHKRAHQCLNSHFIYSENFISVWWLYSQNVDLKIKLKTSIKISFPLYFFLCLVEAPRVDVNMTGKKGVEVWKFKLLKSLQKCWKTHRQTRVTV